MWGCWWRGRGERGLMVVGCPSGVDEVVQIVDLDDEELAQLSEDEREALQEALANEADGCLTDRQASAVLLVDDEEDKEEIEEERDLDRKARSPVDPRCRVGPR